jgi:polysaccharide biosynthesis/export protein
MKHPKFPGSNTLHTGLFFLIFVPVVFCSCGNTRNLVYMQGKFDTAALSQVQYREPVIRKGDIINIIVYSDNPEATKIYNQSLIAVAAASGATTGSANSSNGSTGGGGGQGSNPTSSGYLVDENGNIEFQGLGLLHVDGLFRSQLKDTLDERLKDVLTHPYYTIRFLNNRFTMLGEVNHPGIFTVTGDKISLLDALGLAGDLTFYGRRDNILVIRDSLGTREWGRLDLTKPEIMASPFFYLQSEDVVIVEPTKKKISANDQTTLRNISIITAIASVFAIFYSIFR